MTDGLMAKKEGAFDIIYTETNTKGAYDTKVTVNK
jgi:hypothetical protein